MDRVVCGILVLAMAFLLQYAWQWYRAYSIETLLADLDAPDTLVEHTKEFDEPEVIKVTDGVYVAVGFAIANSILLEGPTGLVVVDTTESIEAGQEIYQAFRKISNKPIKAIIYTHYHPDHVSGAKAFIDDPDNPPDIWAHHKTVEEIQRLSLTAMIIYQRSARQFGVFLPNLVNAGIGPRLRIGTSQGIIYPTKILQGDMQKVQVAGLRLVLFHIPGETTDQIGVWMPEQRVLLPADDIYKTFPNLYAIRGTPPRKLDIWVSSLDKMRQLRPEYLVPSHTKPVTGEDAIFNLLTVYRDAIQFVHDQTVRYMNKGYHPEDIAQIVKLPSTLHDHPYLQQFYGKVEWSVKTVFDSYMGWFSGDPAELYPLPPKLKAERMIELAGGVESILEKAQSALDKDDHRWALELASYVFKTDSNHEKGKEIRINALKKLASRETSANGRNYLLTCAMEDLNLIELKLNPTGNIMTMPLSDMFKVMATRLKAEECDGVNMTVLFHFPDIGENFTFILRNSIIEIVVKELVQWDVKLSSQSMVWREIAAQKRAPVAAYMNGDLVIDGGILKFTTFMGYFER